MIDVSVCAFFPPPRFWRCVRLWCGQGLLVKSLVTSAITTAKVTAIERIQNRGRLREYNHAATTIARNSGDNDSNEKLLFHGTGATDPKEVLLLPQGLGGFPFPPQPPPCLHNHCRHVVVVVVGEVDPSQAIMSAAQHATVPLSELLTVRQPPSLRTLQTRGSARAGFTALASTSPTIRPTPSAAGTGTASPGLVGCG